MWCRVDWILHSCNIGLLCFSNLCNIGRGRHNKCTPRKAWNDLLYIMIYHRYARANNNKMTICENILGSIGVDHWFVCSTHGHKNITSLLAFNTRIPEKLTISKRTCEEASYEKHGKVVREEEDQPASHKGRRESKHEPLLTDSWETDGWMELFFYG